MSLDTKDRFKTGLKLLNKAGWRFFFKRGLTMAAFIQDGQIPVVKDWFAKAVGQEHCRQNTQTVRTLELCPI